MTLARERAIASAYLISGDADIREGVVAAQDMGVRVSVIGIPPIADRFNQAPTLTREADEHVVLDKGFWAHFFALKSPPPTTPRLPDDQTELETARVEGQRFGNEWGARATHEELLEMLGQAPRVPRALDAQLVTTARGVALRAPAQLPRCATRGDQARTLLP
jgi:hypothetical protein